MSLQQQNGTPKSGNHLSSRPFAAIDIGTTSVRMTVAQLDADGEIEQLEFLHQGIALGHDTFTTGALSKQTIQRCVQALRRFKSVLDEYGITEEATIRVIATTAVREAANRDTFIDHVSIATGLRVEPIEDIEVSRLTYLSYQNYIKHYPDIRSAISLITEIGGGSTSLFLVEKRNIHFSNTLRLGSLRIYELMQSTGTSIKQQSVVVKNEINRTVERIIGKISLQSVDYLFALGSDIQFAAEQLLPDWKSEEFVLLPVTKILRLCSGLMDLTVEEILLKYKLSISDAETVTSSLLYYCFLAQACSLKSIAIAPISMRLGILLELSGSSVWIKEFQKQVYGICRATAARYAMNEKHGVHVAHLSDTLFSALQQTYRLRDESAFLLHCAALMHDVGLFINTNAHHKHSLYLIENSQIFGLNSRNKLLVALIARYHRKAHPLSTHPEFSRLDRFERLIVLKMSAILRVADCLDRSDGQRLKQIGCTLEADQFVITVFDVHDLSIEQMALKNKGRLFENVYGLKVVLRTGRKT